MPHPLRVASRQVRVHRNQVRALARQRVEIQWQCGNQRLAFPRRHFRDLSEMQLDTAHQLHVVRDHVPRELVAGDHYRRAQ